MKNRRKSDRKQLAPIDARQMDSLRVFHEVARGLTSSLDLDSLLRTIMSKMEEFFGPEHWSLLMFNEDRTELFYVLSAGLDESLLKDLRLQPGEGIAGYVAATGNPLVVPDISADADWSRYAAAHPELNLRSIACLPIRNERETLGILQLNNSELDLLPEASIAFLRVLCDYAAIALENSRHVKLIQHLSITDDCTGLFNARHLYTLLEQEIRQLAPRYMARVVTIKQRHFSLLFLDLDRFKSVNDTHGHLVGSRLLAEVGNLLKRTLGPSHAAFRYGGDEFVALLRGLDKPAATELSQRILETLREARFLEGEGLSLSLTGSLGLATFPQDGATLHDLIRSSDTMMYAAKEAGRNRLVVANGETPAAHPVPNVSRHS
ncbi:MAG: sensor domain-containing diguanylate cyclase [Acidobacteria bacterium]|nr:sensor domain-containing diguanylate cyclase [Acidobacteriota bacterium]